MDLNLSINYNLAARDMRLSSKSGDEESERCLTEEEWNKMADKEKIVYLHDWLLELYLNMKFQSFEKVVIFMWSL